MNRQFADLDLMQLLRTRILTLPRNVKQCLMIVTDVTFSAVALVASIWIVYGSARGIDVKWIVFAACVTVPVIWAFGLYASIIRYMGFELFRTGFLSTGVVAMVLALSGYWTSSIGAPLRAAARSLFFGPGRAASRRSHFLGTFIDTGYRRSLSCEDVSYSPERRP